MRKAFVSLLVGALSVGLAWAGAGLIPVAGSGSADQSLSQDNWLEEIAEGTDEATAGAALQALQADQVYAGAFKVSINPDPDRYNGVWERDRATCETLTNPQGGIGHITDFRVRWHENTNCIYTGGYDIGPANAATDVDEDGLWARAVAISDGDDTVVLMILDGSYYFAEYANMCNDDESHPSEFDGDGPGANTYGQDCGFRDLQESMAARYGYVDADNRGQLGIEPASFFLASSHAHAAPDFIGAWGGVPRWYMQQVEDAIRAAVYGAIDSMQPAFLEAGEILFRAGNNSRRRHYHAAEEAGVSWFRLLRPEGSESEPDRPGKGKGPPEQPGHGPPSPPQGGPDKEDPPEPEVDEGEPGRNAVATVGTYSAHPVNRSNGVLQADLAGHFSKRAEQGFGGVGLFFQTGFGNMTSAYSRAQLGVDLSDLLPGLGEGRQITGDPIDVRTGMTTFDQPVTNSVLAGGGMSGIFDRPMEQRPSAVSISKDSLGPDAAHGPHKRCNSASPVTVNSSVSVARIGPIDGGVLITGGPGELFSNYTNTVKEKNPRGITLPLSLVNDGLGYVMQSVETDHVGRQAVGFVNGPLSEYEDAYSIDACFGDHALEQTLALMRHPALQ